MARFLVTYRGSEMSHDPEVMAQARQTFVQWAEKTGDALVDQGSPVRSTKTVSSGGTQDGPAAGPFIGWSVIEAADVEAALNALKTTPSSAEVAFCRSASRSSSSRGSPRWT